MSNTSDANPEDVPRKMIAVEKDLYDEMIEFKRAHESWTTFFRRHMDLGMFTFTRDKSDK
jgi:hypothetical protein